ncbi:MAG TPA: CPBP family glutamic-type intramembrane protease [Myxococcaceae bacterium]|nr:CPBP family glutamic-type intramembrane protease [Myxococcaceae bacterium]
MPPRYPWRVVFVLWALAAVGVVAVLPYVLTIQAPLLQKALAAKPLPIPLPAVIALQTLQGLVMVGGLAALGLWLARKMELGAPILEGWLARGEAPGPRLRAIAPRSVVIGAVGGAAIVVVDLVFFSARMKAELLQAGVDPAVLQPSWWKGLLASFYGGCDEELLTRLFLLTFFAWIGAKLTRVQSGRPGAAVLWSANVLAALLFGAGHLPSVKAMGLPVDAMMVTRTLLLNGVVGIAFGWLYVGAGLEAAMIAHFSADLVLHVLTPLFAGH